MGNLRNPGNASGALAALAAPSDNGTQLESSKVPECYAMGDGLVRLGMKKSITPYVNAILNLEC